MVHPNFSLRQLHAKGPAVISSLWFKHKDESMVLNLPSTISELEAMSEADPAASVTLRNFGEIFTLESLVRVISGNYTNLDLFEYQKQHESVLFKSLTATELPSLAKAAVDAYKSFFIDELQENPQLMNDVLLTSGLPRHFRYSQELDFERFRETSLALDSSAASGYPPGVFFTGKRNVHMVTGSSFESVVFEAFLKANDLASAHSPFMCLDSAVVPEGLFEDQAAAFVPTNEPVVTSKLLLMIAEAEGPSAYHCAEKKGIEDLPYDDTWLDLETLNSVKLAVKSFTALA